MRTGISWLGPLRLTTLAAIAVVILAAGCGDDDESPPETQPPTATQQAPDGTDPPQETPIPQEDVRLMLDWVPNPSMAAIFVAQARGFFEEQGLNVDLTAVGTTSPDTAQLEVAEGGAEFANCQADDIPRMREQGLPLIVVAQLGYVGPSVLLVTGDSPVQEPRDLEGGTIGAGAGGPTRELLEPFLNSAGVDVDQVNIVTLSPQAWVPSVLEGQVDAVVGFVATTFVNVQQQDPDARYFLYADYGINVMSYCFTTTESYAEENPDVVRRFVRAIISAYEYTMENPEDAAAASAELYPEEHSDQDYVVAAVEATYSEEFMTPPGDLQFGAANDELWQETLDVMAQYLGVEEIEEPGAYYTNEFLP